MSFHDPQFLWLLCALPLIALWRARRSARASVTFSSVSVAREVSRSVRRRSGGLALTLQLAALGLLVVALARPQRVQAKHEVQASGIDLVLAVDVSSSMSAQDMSSQGEAQDRLTAVKSVVERFIADRPNDRIGLVAFAGGPYLVSPPTLDHAWLLHNLSRLHTGMVQDGTAIGSALTASVNRLRHERAKSKIVILLTDGMNNAGSVQPSLAAQAAAAMGVKVYTIGVGSEGRALMPVTDERGHRRMVMTEVDVDEPTLRKVADVTGGRFFRATDSESLQRVYTDIDAMEKTTRTLDTQVTRSERFQWPALLGLSLLGLTFLAAPWRRPSVP